MKYKDTMQLSLNSDAFEGMKMDFDTILDRTIRNMESKNANEATITLKLGISLTKVIELDDNENEVVKPAFKHDISSVMQVKDKKSGSLSGDYELKWNEEEKKYEIQQIKDSQLSIFDDYEENKQKENDDSFENDYSYTKDIYEEDNDASIDNETPFEWLKQFVGRRMQVTEAMGNYTVRTVENESDENEDNVQSIIILSSASDSQDPFHCDKEVLAPHVGHEVICVGYGEDILVNIAIECEDCFETLFSIDMSKDDDEYEYDEPENI